MKLNRRKTLKHTYAKNEYSESNFIPYEGMYNENILTTKDKELLVVLRVRGFSFETADDEDVDMKKNVRNTLFKSIASAEIALWFHTIRRKEVAHCDGEFKGKFCEYMDQAWENKHIQSESFVNELYITIILRKDTQGAAAGISNVFSSISSAGDKGAENYKFRQRAKDMEEMAVRLASSLKDYDPEVLGVRETDHGVYSEVLEFFGTVVNCGNYSPMLLPNSSISSYLPTNRLYFGKRAIEAKAPDGNSKFAGSISVVEYPTKTNAGMLDSFLQLPFELIISQIYEFQDRQNAVSKMSLHQRRMASAGDKAQSQMLELTDAMDMASGGHIAFGLHALNILVIENDMKSLESALSLCYGELVNTGVNPSRETFNLQASYWSQLPANFEYNARGSLINTLNLAGFASLHNYPTGKANKNHWGPAVTVFDTTSGTPFFFSFHVRDVGHSTIIGPTGAGKTVLMNFLMAQAQKFDCRMFFFDKDRGADIFIRALGGKYSIIEPARASGFNPFQLDDDAVNRTFLSELIRVLCLTTLNEQIRPEENDRIAEAVEGNYKMPLAMRKISNVAPFLGLGGPGSLASRLKIWHTGGTHCGLFDNDLDQVDFSTDMVFGFEMAKLLADGLSLSPVLLYLFHKINISLDGTPTIIVLDEAWALIDNPIFAPKIKDWLKVLRKLNAMVIFATQSVEDISKSDISDTLVQQTATQIFLPNNKATDSYKETFMLSEREYTLIKTTDPGTRYFLVKQGKEVVVARIDLSGMDNVINVLSGRAETVILLDEIIEEVGVDPDNWVEIFFERVKLV